MDPKKSAPSQHACDADHPVIAKQPIAAKPDMRAELPKFKRNLCGRSNFFGYEI
jgi:hypothetical protein